MKFLLNNFFLLIKEYMCVCMCLCIYVCLVVFIFYFKKNNYIYRKVKNIYLEYIITILEIKNIIRKY